MTLPEKNGSIDYGQLEVMEWIEPQVRRQLIVAWGCGQWEEFFALLDSLPRHKAEKAMQFLAGVSG